jgi:hypothetical protein
VQRHQRARQHYSHLRATAFLYLAVLFLEDQAPYPNHKHHLHLRQSFSELSLLLFRLAFVQECLSFWVARQVQVRVSLLLLPMIRLNLN